MKTEALKEKYIKYNLTKEDVFKHQHYIILTRSGIDKIQALENINIDYEVIKCEKAKGTIPPKTFIHCFNKYCREEIKEAPEDWPIVAVGNEAFKLLGCAYPNRKVIGVWHPAYNKGRNFYRTRLSSLELKDRIVEIENKPCWLEDLID